MPRRDPRTPAAHWILAAGLAGTLAAAAAGPGAPAAAVAADDDPAWKDLESRYRKLVRNRDDAANRERRRLLLSLFDFRGTKACRKLLREAYDDELLPDHRIAAVQVLAACGDPKELDYLLTAFRKERMAGPQIALAQGLSYTDAALAPGIALHAAEAVRRQKGEPVRALLEGVGELADPSAFPVLASLGDKLLPEEEFERLVALGACGREQAVAALGAAAGSGQPTVRLGAALGLARTGGPDAPPVADALPLLVELVSDQDPRVVEAAAAALAAAKHAPAVDPLIDAFSTASLRTREALRASLRAITGRDGGHDPEAWRKPSGSAKPPDPSTFAGMTFVSDRVAFVADLSRSMDWNGRLERTRSVLADAIPTLPDDAVLGAVGGARVPVPMAPKLLAGATAKAQADEWARGLLTAGGFDLLESLRFVLDSWPSVDTILLATDSAPWGDAADVTPLEVIQEFRRANRTRNVRVLVAFVAPGGRYAPSEIDAEEYEDRKELLRQFAASTGGEFRAIE